jgi:two-component system, sensor histidine kinase
MKKFYTLEWLKNISISKKLYFAVGIMALLIAVELFTLWFAINTLSSVRAFVAGEGLWSKAQKDAFYQLNKYAITQDESDYRLFLEYMKVPFGDHKARLELLKEKPDYEIARQGFIEGRNHPDDVDGMINLFRRFHNIYYIRRAIEVWTEADILLTPLISIGEELRNEINSELHSNSKREDIMQQLNILNEKLTVLEDEFSYTLGEGSRWLENLILKLLFAVALTVEITGLLITISVSSGIQKGLNEIIEASKAIARGNLSARARAFSLDEIGVLAHSFNNMAEQLKFSINQRQKAEDALKEHTRKLEQSNRGLEQFAYVASHDLQEPLRTITNYTGLLEAKQKEHLDDESRKYMQYVVQGAHRMKQLIKDLLHYSRIGKNHETMEQVNFNETLDEVIADMDALIKENNAAIKKGQLPVLNANKIEIKLLLQNLLSNAIKYRQPNITPHVEFNAVKLKNGSWLFSVKDNGIGIADEFKEKIFIIFQRLHNENEYPGTGIGLATCKKIVELNQGDIWVESKLGEGSIFYFTFNNI